MRSFLATALLSLCILQLGNASEIANKTLITVRELKDQVQSEVDIIKFSIIHYGVELNKELDNAEDQYQEQFDQEVHSALDEIKKAIAEKKGSPADKCYKAAKSRFDKLNVTSHNAVEQCATNKKDGVDPDDVLDSLLTLIKNGNKLIEYVGKLEKEVENVHSEAELKSFDKQVPAVKASLAIYNFAVKSVLKRAARVIDESAEHAKQCNGKELADVHVIALYVRENAFNCINQA